MRSRDEMIVLVAGPAIGGVLILEGTRGAVGLLLASHDEVPGWLLVSGGLATGNGEGVDPPKFGLSLRGTQGAG